MADELNQEQEIPSEDNQAPEEAFTDTQDEFTEPKSTGGVAQFEEFDDAQVRSAQATDKLSMLKDLQLNVYIELGRTQMQIKDVLELERGYVIELDKMASEPVDIFVNNKKIAEGEVVVIDKHFGIRITNLYEANNRLKGLL